MQALPNDLLPFKQIGTVKQSRVAIQSHNGFEVDSHKSLVMDPQLELKDLKDSKSHPLK